ncbi:interferon phi 1 [Megalops cyprinoides]|uniref:interferon phi 1 n=1 Tax=Megalops cyprinoides TaxID=118141 RepID=UPI001864C008|nr:interferon phi 1 [Megalops cyprinoides]
MHMWNFIAFTLLCSVQSLSGCLWIQHGFRHASRESLSLLDQMGGDFTEDRVPVPFPNRLYRSVSKAQVEDKLTFLSETFDQIIQLFNGKLDAVAWNKQKLDHFLAVLDRQSRELKKCVPSSRKYKQSLTRYFRKLKKDVLKQRNFDSSSWELVRKEVRRHLLRLDLMSATGKTEMK